MDFSIILDNLQLFIYSDGYSKSGIMLTIELLLISISFGLILAIPLSILRASNNPILSKPIWLFTYIFRGSPLLVQMYIIYYGLPEITWIRESWMWVFLREAYICAWLAFGLNTAAYTTEIFAGALRNSNHNELEAAEAFGMNKWQKLRYVLIPSAFRRAIPSYSNEVIFTLHGTALASGITLLDLAGVSRSISMRYAAPYEAYIAALILYGIMTFVLLKAFQLLEYKLSAHLRPLNKK